MKKVVSTLTLTFFLFSQVASTEAAYFVSGKSHLRPHLTRTANGRGKGKTLLTSLTQALGVPQISPTAPQSLTPAPVTTAQDGGGAFVPFDLDKKGSQWKEVQLEKTPQSPDDVAKLIDQLDIKYLLNEWTLVERKAGTGGVVKTEKKGNLIAVGPTTRPLLEVGIPTDRSSFSSGFGAQYGTIYDSDGTIKLHYQTLKVYRHPGVPYAIATIDGYVLPTDDPRNVPYPMKGTYGFEKSFEPIVPYALSRGDAENRVMEALKQRKIQEVTLLVATSAGDFQEVRVSLRTAESQSALQEALSGKGVLPVPKVVAETLLAKNTETPFYAVPDPYTLMVNPFDSTKMMMIAEVAGDQGKPFAGDVRYRFGQFLQGLWKEKGILAVVGLEPEWFLIKRDKKGNPVPLDFNLYYDRFQDHPAEVQQVLLRAMEALQAVGISVTNTTSEVAGSQHEWVVETVFPLKKIDAALIGKELPPDLLTARRAIDMFMLYKYLLKETASLYGKEVTFEAKPFEGVNGSGMHTHLSLFGVGEDGTLKNLFAAVQEGKVELSDVGRSAAEGVMRAGREMFVFTNQSPADIYRHVAGYEAPVYTGFYSEQNRSAPIRRPKTTSPNGARFEYRVPAPDSNMYLSTGTVLSAAYYGMREGLKPRPPIVAQNVYHITDEELKNHLPEEISLTDARVPAAFVDAIEIAKQSLDNGGMVRELVDQGFLNEEMVTSYLEVKHRQLAHEVRKPYPFPQRGKTAHDGGARRAESLRPGEIAALLQSGQVPQLVSAQRSVNDISPNLAKIKKVGGLILYEEVLTDASAVKRLQTWPKNVPIALVSPSGKWQQILRKIDTFSNGALALPSDTFTTVITPQTKGISDINNIENVVEVAELETESAIVAYAVGQELRDVYRSALQGAYGIVYEFPQEGSNQVTLGANAFNELLRYLALPKAEQEKLLAALGGFQLVRPSQVADETGQFLLSYYAAVRSP